MEKKKKKGSRNLVALLVIILVLVAIFMIAGSTKPGEEIDLGYAQELVYSGEVTHIYAQGGTAYIRIKNSEIKTDKFPSEADYRFEYTSRSALSFIDEYNYNVIVYKGTL